MIKHIIKPYFLVCISLFLLTSCLRDGEKECSAYITRVKVVIGTLPGTVMPEDTEIKDINLYIFNNTGYLIGKIENVELNEWIDLNYPNDRGLYVAALANASDGDVNLSDPSGNYHLTGSAFMLKTSRLFDSKELFTSPGEIFYGNIAVNNNPDEQEERQLPIFPMVSKINIKVKAHQEYAMHLLNLPALPAINEFRFVLQTKHITVDFMGNPCGSPVYYDSKELVSYEDICELPTLNLLSTPAGEEVIINLYHNETLIDVISGTTQINSRNISPLITKNGQLLEVYINYQSGITISMQNPNWQEGGLLWKDF